MLIAGKPLARLPEETTLPSNGTAADLYAAISATCGTSVHRLRISKGSDGSSIPNAAGVALSSLGLRQQSSVNVKDLGPQVAWRTVFLLEYLGPLLIHPVCYHYFPKTANVVNDASFLQTATFIMIMLHFFKRELETLFVHRFSADTMPLASLVRNVAYYWALSGINLAYWVYRPAAPAAIRSPSYALVMLGIGLYVVGEGGTFVDHLVLMRLRSPGTRERGIPHGWGFDLVTCPNYMFETIAWLGIVLVSRSWSTVFFSLLAVFTMSSWAKKKEKRYRREFGAKYRAKKYVILPGIY